MKIIKLYTSEVQLIERCRKNDSKAQHALYQKMGAKMLGVCRRYTKSIEDAEEVLMNGFIKVFKQIKMYEGKGSFEGWVRRIMINEALNFIRYQKNMFVELNEDHHHLPKTEQNFDDTQEILNLIDELPMGYRTVFNLYAIEGFKHQDIAQMLNISESTSKSQLSKARRLLQNRVVEYKNANLL